MFFYRLGPIARKGPSRSAVVKCCSGKPQTAQYNHFKSWVGVNSTKTLKLYSGLGFIFGKVLSERLKAQGMPRTVGVIQAGIGGTPIEQFADQWAIAKCFGESKTELSMAYNALVHPFVRHSVKGVLWYQGESNSRDDLSHFSCVSYYVFKGYERVWRNNGREIYFGVIGLPPLA